MFAVTAVLLLAVTHQRLSADREPNRQTQTKASHSLQEQTPCRDGEQTGQACPLSSHTHLGGNKAFSEAPHLTGMCVM